MGERIFDRFQQRFIQLGFFAFLLNTTSGGIVTALANAKLTTLNNFSRN